MIGFDALHPAVKHHIVNSLGWRQLRPLQESAVAPILRGDNVLLLAPTAGGKTEAAFFPVFSRMLAEDWSGLSVLYVCPIKALLNNLKPRLSQYAELVGRRVGIWHGDVGQAARRRILRDPPDVLLTTPESIEVMLTSRKTDHRLLFRAIRTVIIDEIHAFAGDDRGWHLLAVIERLCRITGRDLQRLGLSATVGNAEGLLSWLRGSSGSQSKVVAPDIASTEEKTVATDVCLDYVGSLGNAARVISQLHSGEKRLVFCDSRSRVEGLAAELRKAGMNTFVSHSSLSLDERRSAERAFSEGRDAVIVATSTLELGIDVGDLDRVIQIDSPGTVASFLQRLGRTGRRAGSTRNCLFLATSEDAFLHAAGLLQLWNEGFVEPMKPPALPYHILAQQVMALVLQERGVGRETWPEWIAGVSGFEELVGPKRAAIIEHMLREDILFEDAGILSFGVEGEGQFGYRNFIELVSVFTSDPLFSVRSGATDLGYVHPLSFIVSNDAVPVLLLAGRSWVVTHIDWKERVAYVEPSESKGRSQWLGSGKALHFEHCRAVRKVLAQGRVDTPLSKRGKDALDDITAKTTWVDEASTVLLREANGTVAWWTFAGLAANTTLGTAIKRLRRPGTQFENLRISLVESVAVEELQEALIAIDADSASREIEIEDEALEGLKFSDCLPRELAIEMLRERTSDRRGVAAVLREPLRSVSEVH